MEFNLEKATLIKSDGTVVELEPKGKKFTYDEVYEAIGNIIEPICLNYYTKDKEYKKMNLVCDEEGVINGSAYNEKASQLLKDVIGADAQALYGNVILMPNKLFNLR